jgi:TIR domain/Pentapeptide repeats (8 copies)
MANRKHLAKLMEGVEAWNKCRVNRFKNADLSNADLHEMNLSGVNFFRVSLNGCNLRGADLSGADLSHASLWRSDLRETNCTGADFDQCYLAGANFSGANLDGADLSEADLSEIDLSWANVNGSDFDFAFLWGATFLGTDLSTAKNIDTIQHQGPSTVDLDTIYKSKGKLPAKFLRGVGVPDDFITFISSLTTNSSNFYTCFISYSTKDQDFADRLYADLQEKGVRCWFAPHDIRGGRKLHEQIDEAIRLNDKVLLILSPHSMQSEWVKTEIAKARKRELRYKQRILFPIRLAPFETLRDWECFDADAGKDSAREIREYFIPDFSNWEDHDFYQEAFRRLIADLKSPASKLK